MPAENKKDKVVTPTDEGGESLESIKHKSKPVPDIKKSQNLGGVKETTPPADAKNQPLSGETSTVLEERPLEEEVPLEKVNKKLFNMGVVSSLVIIVLTSLFLFMRGRFFTEESEDVVTVSEEVVFTPEPSPTSLERGEISIEVLNGSGISGLAGDTVKELEALGYEDIEAGNADSQEGNTLFVSKEKEDVVGVLLEDLEDILSTTSISGELEDSDFDAQIILGE